MFKGLELRGSRRHWWKKTESSVTVAFSSRKGENYEDKETRGHEVFLEMLGRGTVEDLREGSFKYFWKIRLVVGSGWIKGAQGQ